MACIKSYLLYEPSRQIERIDMYGDDEVDVWPYPGRKIIQHTTARNNGCNL